MNKRFDKIRAEAIEVREKLSYANPDDQSHIEKLDKIIRGAVLFKWIHLLASFFFIIFAASFLYFTYPDIKFMMVISGLAAGGYAISWFGMIVQLKLFERTIGKVRSAWDIEKVVLKQSGLRGRS